MTYQLVLDVGGTNTFVGVIEIKQKKPVLVYTNHHLTSSIKSFTSFFTPLVSYLQQKYHLRSCVIGAAGIIKDTKVSLVNANIIFDTKLLSKKTNLSINLINDFQALALGIQFLDKKDFLVVHKGNHVEHGTKAVIGAGTGLGKAILIYDQSKESYNSLPSEGGHGNLPLENVFDNELADYIKTHTKKQDYQEYPLSYEDVLSGRGLEILYAFMKETEFKQYKTLPEKLSAAEIAESQGKNPCSKKAMKLFVHYYARCSRNFALEVLPNGGLYLAGGIATHNPEIFTKYDFIKEFQKHAHPHYQTFLKRIPILVVKNNLISLLGAGSINEK
ncbi:ROK family protein [Candidatus Woesearchaeota archaeon]|nr:ROK family protein [Candidatus Woesearchaeota archaeon]